MAEKVFPFGLGLVSGIILAIALLLVIRELNRQQQSSQQPQMTSYNVVRDSEGRITNVESLSGLPLDGQQPQAQRGQISPGQQSSPEVEG